MDWNWFFSSLAQSVAAIVGIFAAFIITKVINSQSEFSRKSSRIKELLSISERYSESLKNRSFQWYCERKLENDLDDLKDVIENSEDTLSAEEYYEKASFPIYIQREEVLNKIGAVIQQHSTPRGNTSHNSPYIPIPIEITRIRAENERRLRDSLKKEGSELTSLIIDVKQHTRLVSLHLSEIENNPESSKLIRYSIIGAIILFFIGVMYPLTFLPVNTANPVSWSFCDFMYNLFSPKGLILFLVSATFTSMLVVFWRVNEKLKYPIEDVNKLKTVSKVENYSKYLKIMNDNINEYIEWRKNKESEPEK